MSQRARGTSQGGSREQWNLPSAGDCVSRRVCECVHTPPEPRHLHWNAKSLFILLADKCCISYTSVCLTSISEKLTKSMCRVWSSWPQHRWVKTDPRVVCCRRSVAVFSYTFHFLLTAQFKLYWQVSRPIRQELQEKLMRYETIRSQCNCKWVEIMSSVYWR